MAEKDNLQLRKKLRSRKSKNKLKRFLNKEINFSKSLNVILFIIVLLLTLLVLFYPVTVQTEQIVIKSTKSTECIDTKKHECLIKKHFGTEWRLAWVIMMAESSGRENAVSYNCMYTENGKRYSTFCKKGDEHKAWSKDRGLFGINDIHKLKSNSKETNVMKAKEIRDRDGWKAWSSYNYNRYKKFM